MADRLRVCAADLGRSRVFVGDVDAEAEVGMAWPTALSRLADGGAGVAFEEVEGNP